jgi:hypothetical protein
VKVDRGDIKEDGKWGNRCGVKNSSNLAQSIILCNSHLGHDRFGVPVIYPDCGSIGKDWEDNSHVGLAPVGIVQTTDRVAKNVKRADSRAGTIGHNENMRGPRKRLV